MRASSRVGLALVAGLLGVVSLACSSTKAAQGSDGSAGTEGGAAGAGGTGGSMAAPDASADVAAASSLPDGCPRSTVLCNGYCLGAGQTAAGCTALIADDTEVGGLGLSTTHLYYGISGRIDRRPLSGGPPEAFLQGIPGLILDFVDTNDLYVLSFVGGGADPGTIHHVPFAGGPPQTVTTGTGEDVYALTADSFDVFWVGLFPGSLSVPPQTGPVVHRAPTGGGAVSDFGSGSKATSVAVDINFVYWFDGGIISRTSKMSPGAVTQVADIGKTDGIAMALDGDYVYWTSGAFGGLYRAPKAGGAPEMLAAVDQGVSIFIAPNDIYLGTLTGKVVRYHRMDGSLQTLATTSNYSLGMLVVDDVSVYDDKSVYFTASISGTKKGGSGLLKIAR
jgi:hypothetical protein